MERTSTLWTRVVVAVVAAVATCAVAGVMAQTANADALTTYSMKEFKGTFTVYQSTDDNWFNVTGSKKFSALKSSKKSVAKVEKDGSKKLMVTVKKPGTTKISFKYGGKKKTVKMVVKKYTCPVKTFKIGSKNLTKKYKKTDLYDTTATYTGKLKVKAKSGWKVGKIKVLRMGDEDTGLTTIKSGSKIKDMDAYIYVQMINKKTKGEIILQYGTSGWL